MGEIHGVKGGSALSEGKEILCPFDGVLEAAEELLEIGVAIDEVNVRSIDDQQIGSRVAEEKVFVGAHDRFEIFGGNLGFFASALLGDAFPQNFRLGLEIDNQVGWPKLGSKPLEVTVVELQFFVVEIQVGEDLVLLEQKIRQHRPGGFHGERFVQAAGAVHQKIHLRAQGRARVFNVR